MATDVNAKLTELFGAQSVAGYYNTKQEPVQPYLGAVLFPPTRVIGKKLKDAKGRASVPVALRASALDANAPLRDRIPLQIVENELPFFREAQQMNEELIMELIPALKVGDDYAKPIIDKAYDDRYTLILSAEVTAERLRMALLCNGSISILDAKDNVPIEADYGFDPAAQKTVLAGTDKWDQVATSNPLQDIEAGQQAVGLGDTRAIMTQATYNYMKQSASLKNAMFPSVTPSVITNGQVEDYLSSNYKLSIIVLTPRQNQYRFAWDAPNVRRQFFRDGVVTLIPAGVTLGETVRGSTPEELTAGMNPGTETVIVNNGVAVRTYTTDHTVNINTVVSQTVLPSFPGIDSMYIIEVF